MGKKLVYDAHGDIVSVVEHDEMAGKTTFAQFQDTQPYFEENKRLQNMNDGYNKSRDIRRVASIPNIFMLKMLREAGINPLDYFRKPRAYKTWLRRKLYSSDYSFLLTAPHKAR